MRGRRHRSSSVERVLLKAFCGMLASGGASVGGNVIRGEPRKEWLELLYGKQTLSAGSGLYARVPNDKQITTAPRFQSSPLVLDDGRLAGFRFNVAGVILDLSLVGSLLPGRTTLRLSIDRSGSRS